MRRLKKLFQLFIILIISNSCIETFEADFKATDTILVVDGNLSDQAIGNFVTIKASIPSSSSDAYFSAIEDATVKVFIDGIEKVILSHTEKGRYEFPDGFIAEAGKSYQLKFTLANGEVYSSNEQKIKRLATIKKVYQKFEERGIEHRGKSVPGHKIYLDTEDPKGKGDAYYWTWRLYENEEYCASCWGGFFRLSDNATGGYCLFDQSSKNDNITWDYKCDGKCWRIIDSDKLNAINDAFVDGNTIEARLVAEVPYYNEKGAILEITQRIVSDQAYKFIKLLIDQNQNSGSLVDTPSTALVGNMKNESNPRESVGGFFVISSATTYSHYVDRSEVPPLLAPIGFVSGRARREEETGGINGPPLAPCLNTRFRTNVPPQNWRF